MEITLICDDGERKTIKIPELNNYPEILLAKGRAFKRHPQTDEYVEVSYWHVPLAESWDFLK
ncbi:hypothetical protein [Nostoc sp.]|uniref:hypothetical protein n=1 Tax=Nostoc sp. TaxID=1180 RepID=UPI002FFCC36E